MSINLETAFGTPRPDLLDAYKQYTVDGTNFAHNSLPAFGVNSVTGEIESVSRTMLKPGNISRASNVAAYNRGSIGLTKVAYTLTEKGWEQPVGIAPDAAVQLNKELAAAQQCRAKIEVGMEIEMAAILQDAAINFTVAKGNYGDPATAWTNIAATIVSDVQDACASILANTGVVADTLFLNRKQLGYLMKNTQLRASFGNFPVTYDQFLSMVAPMLALNKIVVSTAVYDSADPGDPFVGANIWSDSYVLVAKVGDGLNPSVAKKVYVEGDAGIVLEDYAEPQTRSNVVRARTFSNTVLFDEMCGYLIKVD